MTIRDMFRIALVVLTLSYALEDASAAGAEPVRMSDVVIQYLADWSDTTRFHEGAWSASRQSQLDRLYTGWLARLRAIDFEASDQTGKVDYLLLRNSLEQSRAELVRSRRRLVEIDELIAFRETIDQLETARVRGDKIDGQAVATQLSDLAGRVKLLTQRVENGVARGASGAHAHAIDKSDATKQLKPAEPLTVTPAQALRAADATDGMRRALKQWFAFYDGFNPELTWWLKKPCDDADKQLEAFGKLLRQQVAGQKGEDHDPLVGDPIGAAAVAEEIAFEFLPYTAAELIAIGERELAWGEGEMKKAAREMNLGDDWHAAMAKVKGDYVQPGEQDTLVAAIARESIEFVKRQEFATIPALCEETWRLEMLSPEALKTIPYAAYGGQQVMVAYANQSMQQDDKVMVMRGNNRAFTRLTTIHELIPGHHLQRFQAQRHKTYRAIFGTPFYVEGWALYCELQFWKRGWARTPEERIGMLFWRMNRAARIVVSLKYHLGEMKPDAMVDFMIQRVGHEKFGATSEVRRFISASPLYQAGYLLGGLQLMALHDEMVMPGGMTDRQFHDAVLAAHTLPIELLRAELRNLPVTRDTRPAWRFADDGK